MSTFLNSYLNDIPLGYTILQMQNALVGHLTANGWQLLAQVDGDHSDLIPPATETIGTSKFREVVRIYFPNNTTITIGSYQAGIADAYPQSIRLTAKTAGAVQAGVTINGVTVLGAMGSSGSSANDNLQALYYALMDSVDPTITGWTFAYNGNDTLICTAKTPAAVVACSGNANVNYFAHAQSVLAGARSGYANIDSSIGYSVTVDLTNGFVYYMDIFSRSFTLSTKCLSGTTGPIFASYADHAEALSTLPPNGGLCTPIELLVGNIPLMKARATHHWAACFAYGNKSIPNIETSQALSTYDGTPEWHPFMGSGAPNTISDCGLAYCNQIGGPVYGVEFPLYESGIVGVGTNLERFKSIPLGSGLYSSTDSSYRQQSVRFAAPMSLPDLHVWGGTEPNEASALCQVQPPLASYPTLAQALDATTAYASIQLSSTAGLLAQGSFIIGTEGFTYTGVSGSNVTGVTRGANGTAQARHFIGHTVYPATWFLKVNNGAVCCGPNKPV